MQCDLIHATFIVCMGMKSMNTQKKIISFASKIFEPCSISQESLRPRQYSDAQSQYSNRKSGGVLLFAGLARWAFTQLSVKLAIAFARTAPVRPAADDETPQKVAAHTIANRYDPESIFRFDLLIGFAKQFDATWTKATKANFCIVSL